MKESLDLFQDIIPDLMQSNFVLTLAAWAFIIFVIHKIYRRMKETDDYLQHYCYKKFVYYSRSGLGMKLIWWLACALVILDPYVESFLKMIAQFLSDLISRLSPVLQLVTNQIMPDEMQYVQVNQVRGALFLLLVIHMLKTPVWRAILSCFGEKAVHKVDQQLEKLRKKLPFRRKQPSQEERMYVYDQKFRRWFLKPQYLWLRALSIIVLGFTISVGILSSFIGSLENVYRAFCPICIATEMLFSCAGETRREFIRNRALNGVESGAHNMSINLNLPSGDNNSFIRRKEIDNRKQTEEVRETFDNADPIGIGNDDTIDIVDRFLYRYQENEIYYDSALIQPSKMLLSGKSVVFATRFYQDMDFAFFLPLVRAMQNQRKCLVLLGESINTTQMKQWLERGLELVTGSAQWWGIGPLGDADGEIDIAFFPAELLDDGQALLRYEPFLRQVEVVLITSAATFARRQFFGVSRLAKQLPARCVFALCGDNAVGLRETYSHLLCREVLIAYPTTETAQQTTYLFCDREAGICEGYGALVYQQIALAHKLQPQEISSVRWYSRSAVPIRNICGTFPWDCVTEDETIGDGERKIILGIDTLSCPRQEIICVIVEDESQNPAELSRQFASRGRQQAVVAVVSPWYPMREYIWDSRELFHSDLKCVAQAFPVYCMTERNAVLQILWALETGAPREQDISIICQMLGQPCLEEALQADGHIDRIKLVQKIKEYFPSFSSEIICKPAPHSRGWLGDERKRENLFQLSSGSFNSKRHCRCYFVDETFQEHLLPQYTLEQMCQAYLPHQHVVLDGKYYRVENILQESSGNCIRLCVCRADAETRLQTRYRQKRVVTFHKPYVPERKIYQRNGVEIWLVQSTLEVETCGCWPLPDGPIAEDCAGGPELIPVQATQGNGYRRGYNKRNVLRVSLSDQGYRDQLADMLSELFQTVYADYVGALLVCVDGREQTYRDTVCEARNVPEETESAGKTFYIVEDSNEDIGLLDSIEWNFDRYMRILWAYNAYNQRRA